jgi:hypothetical protein
MCGRIAQPKKKRLISEQHRMLKEFGCKLCGNVLSAPLSTPCGHTFCKVRARRRVSLRAPVCDVG